MRIAIIVEVFLPKIDGVVNRTLNLIQQLKQAGDEVMIVCPQAQGCEDCAVPVVSLPSFPFPMYPEYRVGLPDRRLARAMKQFSPDVIHYLNPFAFGFRCHDALRKSGVLMPSVFSFHTHFTGRPLHSFRCNTQQPQVMRTQSGTCHLLIVPFIGGGLCTV